MRAAKVPSNIAATAKGVHYVVTTVNTSASYQAYQQRTHVAASTLASHPPPPFRFTSLLPVDWSALLHMCRRLTHPSASFNFSSPGDTAEHPHNYPHFGSSGECVSFGVKDNTVGAAGGENSVQTAGTAAPPPSVAAPQMIQNHAYMHIVERVAGDFTPNNMIYHQLQKFHLVPVSPRDGAPHSAAAPTAFSTTSSSSMADFSRLVTALQQQTPQSPHDVVAELLNAEDTARAAASAEEKRAHDPLSHNADALAKSAANVEQLRAYTTTTMTPPSPCGFVFYPHPVSAAVSIAYCSANFCVMVNLKPIVPHHLMVVPIRCVGSIHGLTEAEVEEWGRVMACTINVLEDLRQQEQQQQQREKTCGSKQGSGMADSSPSLSAAVGNYSIAVQQGALAGQTVAHLHVHVIPFDPQGKLAGEPESDEEEQRRRPPRTPAEMQAETDALKPLFAKYAAAAAAAAPAVPKV